MTNLGYYQPKSIIIKHTSTVWVHTSIFSSIDGLTWFRTSMN